MENVEYVGSAVVAEERTLPVTFVPNVSANEKAPKFKAYLHHTGALAGIVTEFPIYKARDGVTWEVTMPGGKSFPTTKAEPLFVQNAEGIDFETKQYRADGVSKVETLLAALKTAFGLYIASNGKATRQEISLN